MKKPAAEQVEIDFGPRVKAHSLWSHALGVVRNIVARVGPKEAAYQADMAATMLGDALAERERKAIRAETLICLLLLADADERRAVLEPIAAALGFTIEPMKTLTPEQKLARLEKALRSKLGELGVQIIAEVGR